MDLQVSQVEPRMAGKTVPRWGFWLLLAIISLGFALRVYRITGWIMDNDESHFLVYAHHPSSLVVTGFSTYARPDCLFALLCIPSVHLLGPNELGMRIWPVLFGTLSIFAIAVLVWRYTNCHRSALWAAGLLAVFPLHVFLSTKATPDVIAIFFLICALIQLIHVSRPGARASNFIFLCATLALAILAKLTSLCLWFFVLLALPLVIPDKRNRLWGYLSMFLALLPVVAMVIAAKRTGSPMNFFEEQKLRSHFGFSLDRVLSQIGLFWRFYASAAVLAGVGAWIAAKRRLELPGLLLPLSLASLWLVFVAPYFRSHIRDLAFLIPTLWPFIGLSVGFFTGSFLRTLPLMVAVAANIVLTLTGVSQPNYNESSWSGRSTAILDRPSGWPSRAITAWMGNHVAPNEGLLITGLGHTDPLVLSFRGLGIRYYSAPSFWELLQDPANKIRFVVFVDDASRYAPALYRYARTHFTMIQEPSFTGYMLFDCKKKGQFVAYPDALNSSTAYANQGARLAQRGNYKEAINYFLTALRQDSSMKGVKRMLMNCYIADGQKMEAIQVGRAIIADNPRDPDMNRNLAILYDELGMGKEALAQCRQNIKLGISPGPSYGVMARTLEKMGKFEEAKEAYEKSLQLEPENPVTKSLADKFRADHPQLY